MRVLFFIKLCSGLIDKSSGCIVNGLRFSLPEIGIYFFAFAQKYLRMGKHCDMFSEPRSAYTIRLGRFSCLILPAALYHLDPSSDYY